MTQRVKTEQWQVKELISKIENKTIRKEGFQRKKKWGVLPSCENTKASTERRYIDFLYTTQNSVLPITLATDPLNPTSYSNIDGNNRINATKHFMDTPFDLYEEYLHPLYTFIDNMQLSLEDKVKLKGIFQKISYIDIINFKYKQYFAKIKQDDLYAQIKNYKEDLEEVIQELQYKLKLPGECNFDTGVIINVTIFENYNTYDLCQVFEQINKYTTTLTKTEILAAHLNHERSFVIEDPAFKHDLEYAISEYYIQMSKDEVLECYVYDPIKDGINGFDFITGFALLLTKTHMNQIQITIDKDDLFKLYNILYNDVFDTPSVNNFVLQMSEVCRLLSNIINSIFHVDLNNKLFKKSSCKDKIKHLKQNSLVFLIAFIIGCFNKKDISSEIINKNVEICILYHCMIGDIDDKVIRNQLQLADPMNAYRNGGSFVDKQIKKLINEPEHILNNLNSQIFIDLLQQLYKENNTPYLRNIKPPRRKLTFSEKIIMFYYYKQKIPINMLKDDFSVEHICPNSSEWDGMLDKDRTGNLIPIIASINSLRGNRHINEYSKTEPGRDFCKFITDIIPTTELYNQIITYDKKPTIINIELYNQMCLNNEQKYTDNFIKCLFT